ncbi:MAG: UvrB/UvrC motif-containing protein [Candidatus Methylacidiphilales bacterium]
MSSSSTPTQWQPDLTAKVRALPHKPGVYLYKDRFGRVIYVGKANDLHRRVSQYFHPSRRMTADRKTRALLESIWDMETHVVKSNTESLLLEGKLIKEYRPRYNISFRDDKHFLMVKVNMADPIPRFQLTRMKSDDGARYFGPFAHSSSLRSTLQILKLKFKLRSCRTALPGEQDFKHCLDHVIQNCSAPCINRISRDDYRAQVQAACDFLEGRSSEMIRQIETEMRAAATRLDFEKAASLRNLLEDLKKTTAPTKRFARQFVTTVRPHEDMAELGRVLDLKEPPQIIECFDISNISTTYIVASMVCFRGGKPDNASYRRYRIRTVQGQNDFDSMAEVVRRRYQRVLGEGIRMPSLVVVDGGKGQLSAAHGVLKQLGLGDLPLIGLAKEREEIFRPGISDPLVLDHGTGALRLLQRVRDEAHRFANGYHQVLLRQRVRESVLDDCPGISDNRKRLLLLKFGSIERLRKATEEEIATVEGIGPKLAAGIVAYLKVYRSGRRTQLIPDDGKPAKPQATGLTTIEEGQVTADPGEFEAVGDDRELAARREEQTLSEDDAVEIDGEEAEAMLDEAEALEAVEQAEAEEKTIPVRSRDTRQPSPADTDEGEAVPHEPKPPSRRVRLQTASNQNDDNEDEYVYRLK